MLLYRLDLIIRVQTQTLFGWIDDFKVAASKCETVLQYLTILRD